MRLSKSEVEIIKRVAAELPGEQNICLSDRK